MFSQGCLNIFHHHLQIRWLLQSSKCFLLLCSFHYVCNKLLQFSPLRRMLLACYKSVFSWKWKKLSLAQRKESVKRSVDWMVRSVKQTSLNSNVYLAILDIPFRLETGSASISYWTKLAHRTLSWAQDSIVNSVLRRDVQRQDFMIETQISIFLEL